MMLKMAVLAPMPSARVKIATAEKVGFCRRRRTAKRRLMAKESMGSAIACESPMSIT